MAYTTIEKLRSYLVGLPDDNQIEDQDEELADVLTRAIGIVEDIDGGLGFSFAGYAGASSRKVQAYGGCDLRLPPYQPGSLTAISYAGAAVEDYEINPDDHRYLYLDGEWELGRYDVTAAWGYGDAPDSIIEIVLEHAVNIWQSRMAGRFTNIVGNPEAGAVGYEGALTPLQRKTIAGVRKKFRDVVV